MTDPTAARRGLEQVKNALAVYRDRRFAVIFGLGRGERAAVVAGLRHPVDLAARGRAEPHRDRPVRRSGDALCDQFPLGAHPRSRAASRARSPRSPPVVDRRRPGAALPRDRRDGARRAQRADRDACRGRRSRWPCCPGHPGTSRSTPTGSRFSSPKPTARARRSRCWAGISAPSLPGPVRFMSRPWFPGRWPIWGPESFWRS